MSRLPVPTPRLAAVAAAMSVVVLAWPGTAAVGLLVVETAVVAVAIVDWALAPRPARIGVTRDAPAVVTLDDEAVLRWRVDNPTGRPQHVRVADELGPSLRPSRRRFDAVVPSGGATTETATIRPARRGRVAVNDVVVRVDGPLGLASRQGRRSLSSIVRVYPRFRSRDEAELRIRRARLLEVGLRSAQTRGGGTEFDSLREYSVDDEFRRVDWAATARVGKPIVRTYRAERNQTVLVLLDCGRTMAARVGGVPRLDHAMDAAMMLAVMAGRLGDRTGLVAFDRKVRTALSPAAGRRQVGRVTEAMYDLEPQLVESDYRGAFAEALVRFRRRALVVVLTELAVHVVEESLLPALPLVVRDHLVVVGSVVDPDVHAWATAVPADAHGAYRKAAAVDALAQRRRAVARLRGIGATVVDAPPGELAPRLADAYLKVKAAGRL